MTIANVQPKQIDDIGELSAVAFADDPIFREVFTDRRRHRAYLLTTLAITLRSKAPERIARVALRDDAVVGVAVWNTEGAKSLPTDLDRDMSRVLRKFLRRLGPDRQRFARFVLTHRATMPMEPGWLLGHLAVHPDHHRSGIGSALLADGLARADAQGRTVFVQTSRPEYVAFYERSGFTVISCHELYPDSPLLWNLRRAPSIPPDALAAS